LFLLCFCAVPASAAFSNGYSYERAITIPYTSVTGGANLANFPALVCFNTTLTVGGACPTVSDLTYGISGSHVTNSSGYDIIFTSDAAGTTKLNWEIELYTGSTGAAYFWVQIPTLSGVSPSTTFYMFYGNSSISTLQTPGSPWDSNYVAVYHLKEQSGTTSANSVSSATNATWTHLKSGGANPTPTTSGEIDGALTFSGAVGTNDDEDDVSSVFGLTAANVTMEAWANISSLTTLHGAFLKIGSGCASGSTPENCTYPNTGTNGTPGTGYAMGIGSGAYDTAGSNFLLLYETNRWMTATTGFTATGWHSAAFVVGASGYPQAYLDGVSAYSDSSTGPVAPAGTTYIGGYEGSAGDRHFDGTLDEVRISNTIRSGNWIATEYANMHAVQPFLTLNATQLVFTTSPVNVAAGSCAGPITVTSEDPNNNAQSPSSTETIALTSNSTGTYAFYTASGCATTETSVTIASTATTATFYYKDTKAGTPTVTASGTGAFTSAPTQVETITPLSATQLVFTTAESTTGTGGTVWATQPVVTAEDTYGNVATSWSTAVSLAIHTGTGVLTCTTNPLTPTLGVAAFAGCSLNKSGSYTLTATSGALTAPTYPPITISVGAAAQLVFTTQPGGGTAGTAWASEPAVTLEDAGGNTVTGTAQTVTVAIWYNAGSPAGTLSGTAAVAVVTTTGIATFTNLTINKAGTNYTLTATGNTVDTTAGTVVSSAFPITAAAVSASISTVTASPGGVANNGTAFATVTVTLLDQYGNPVSGKTVTLAQGSGHSTISAASGPSSSSGVVTFTVKDTTSELVTYTATDSTDSTAITPTAQVNFNLTAVRALSFSVTSLENGNLVRFETARDVNNLGFNIYREQRGERVKLNPSLLAGSALLGGPGRILTGGTRTWLDASAPAGEPAKYWVEEVDLSGARTWYGPATEDGASAADRREALRQGASALRAVPLSTVGRSPSTVSAPARVSVKAAPTPDAVQMQYALAAGQAVKLAVSSEGWYRVTQPQLVAAGLSPNVNPRGLQLYANGVQQPILVEGEAGGRFGPQSAIDFYGLGGDTIWSGTQEYWLVTRSGPGMRIGVADTAVAPPGASGAAGFAFTVEWQPRTLYYAALLNGNSDANSFFGPVLDAGDPLNQALTVTHLNTAQSGSSSLQITLQGASAGPHALQVTLNGNAVGEIAFRDFNNNAASFEVPNSGLREGANTLGLTVTGGDSDVSCVDTVLLSYPHSYQADNNYLRLTAASGQAVSVSGFSDAAVVLADVTDPSAVTLLPFSQSGGTVTFLPLGGGTRTVLAVGSSQFASPASVVANDPSSWHAAQSGGDMVIIAHSSLLAAVAPLASLRRSEGRTVQVIDVQDLYDEFSYGVESPYAIRDFLQTALANWAAKPAYVLLMGNGTFDPRNYLQSGVPDLAPVKLVDATELETASDDWYADFNNDGIPEMGIGRIPAETATDAEAAVNRLLAYDQSGGAWRNQALVVTGVDEDPGDNFEGLNAAVTALLPGSMAATQILGSDPQGPAELLAALNAGQSLVSFAGHGSNGIWADGLLSSEQAAGLTNGAAAPVVLSMTCLNGYFQDVYTEALAKALLVAPNGGAAAVWASSGLTNPSPQSNLGQAMVKALFTPGTTIGDAARAAKAATTDMDVRRTWILFGDPAMKLQ
jgi:hypothetical protein